MYFYLFKKNESLSIKGTVNKKKKVKSFELRGLQKIEQKDFCLTNFHHLNQNYSICPLEAHMKMLNLTAPVEELQKIQRISSCEELSDKFSLFGNFTNVKILTDQLSPN